MNCQRCNSVRVLLFNGKVSDLFSCSLGSAEHEGYVPDGIGCGRGGDYLSGEVCLDCGQMQGKFPLPESGLDKQNQRMKNVKWVLQRKPRVTHPGVDHMFAEFLTEEDGTPCDFYRGTQDWSYVTKFTDEEKENTVELNGYQWVLISDVSY